MHRRFAVTLALILLPLGTRAGGDEPSADVKGLQGTWTIESLEINGKVARPERIEGRVAKIEGNAFSDGNATKVFGKGTFTLDASPSPKTIDAKFTDGPPKGQTVLGIYELNGDSLKACTAEPGEARPTSFSTKSGTGHLLVVYRRSKP